MPVPKVIDFGIAKATEGRLTNLTVYTELRQFIGTPAYMSPEQAEMSGLDIDTRSDIYALGVLLYELLTGKTPFDAKELLAAGLDQMRRIIREKEPVRPSTRLTQELVAASRQSAADSGEEDGGALPSRHYGQVEELIRLLRGDLDWIVMKCLEKDRTRRYETTNGLARDIERHLNNEPVIAPRIEGQVIAVSPDESFAVSEDRRGDLSVIDMLSRHVMASSAGLNPGGMSGKFSSDGAMVR